MDQRLFELWFKLLYPTGTIGSAQVLRAFQNDASAIYKADDEIYRTHGISEKDIKKLMQKELTQAEDLWETCAQNGVLLLWPSDPHYPHALDLLPDRPSLLFALGDVSVLNRKGICIVGSRSASARGSAVAAKLTQQAISSGFIPVTGAATGIDSVVLSTAASLRSPAVSVAAAGLDVMYPADVYATRQKLCAAGGCVFSEFLFGLPARTHHFPLRNRLLPALSQGVFIAEAGLKSGALLTAHHATEQKKPLFAVPGYIDDPHFAGCNRLIGQGAILVADIAEAFDHPALQGAFPSSPVPPVPPVPIRPTVKKEAEKPEITHPSLKKIYDCLSEQSLSTEEIIIKTGLTAAEASAALVLGCLKGILDKSADDRYSIK